MFGTVVHAMRRLSYPTRFAVIGAVFAAALLFLACSLYRITQQQVDFSAKERLGVEYIRAIPSLIEAVQQHRLLVSRAALGAADAQARAKAGQRVQEALAELQRQPHLDTALATLPPRQQIERAWQALRAAPGGADSFARHSALVEQLLALLVQACDQSNLTLDPDIDSYYLMDGVCVKLPMLMARVGESRGLGVLALSAKRLDAAQRTRLVELRPLLADASRAALHNFERVFRHNPALERGFEARRQQLGQRLALLRGVVDQVLQDQFELYPQQAYLAGSGAIGDALALHAGALEQLDGLLEARIRQLQWLRNLYLGTAAVALLLCVYLFVALYMSITRQLGGEPFYVEAVVRQIASGKLTTPIQMRADDHDSLLASISDMQRALFEAIGELQTLSRYDVLTGLANRRFFDERKEQEFRRAKRDQLPLAVLMCDVDEFKRYNDCYGHRAGDICLEAIGQLMQQQFQRAGDLAARAGGEEFAVLLANTTLEEAGELAERLRQAVGALAIPHRSSPVAEVVTISIGVACMADGALPDFDSLLLQADRALYQAKASGRNRVALSALPQAAAPGAG